MNDGECSGSPGIARGLQRMPESRADLWRCPNCGNTFVSKNMWHSCGRFELEPLFERSEPHVFELFERFIAFVQDLGPVTVIPQKSRIAIQALVRFTGCIPRKDYLECSFWFTRRRASPRFHKIERFGPSAFGHYTRIRSEAEFDDEFRSWLHEAYQVGQRKHLDRS